MKALKALPLLFLAILCACLLTGCGKQKDVTAEVTTEDELVFVANYTPVHLKNENGLDVLAVTEDGFYAACYVKLPTGENDYEQQVYYVNQSGDATLLAYEHLPAPENTEGLAEYTAYTNLSRLFVLPDGDFMALEGVYRYWTDTKAANPDDGFRYDESFWVRHMSAEGKEISSAPLQWEKEGEDSYLDPYSAVVDPQGRTWANGGEVVYVFNADGSSARTIELDDWANRVVPLSDGRVGAILWGMNGMELSILDAEKGVVSEHVPIDDVYPEEFYPGYGEYALLFSSGTTLYGLNVGDHTVTALIDLMVCDLTAQQLRSLRAREDGSFIGVAGDYTELNFVTLTQVPRSSLGEKQVITLGVLYPDMVSDAVIRFNRQHPDVRIEIVDYSQYADANTEEEAMEGLSKLTTEIMAGNMPDLLALESMPYEQLAAKGLLEDLYPWIDADGELSREDFIPSVLQASEMDGKLYQAAPGFTVLTLIGASDVVGEEPGWTFDELQAALAAMPEGCSALDPYMARDSVLMMLLFMDMKSYVNWENASCDFENEDFYKLLRFCASFPAEPDYSADNGSVTGRIAAGKQMLLDSTISDLDEISYNDQYFGGSCTYIGYPTRSGSGNVLMLSSGYAMSASCRNKEAAWSFLRTFLTADYQREQYGLPLRRDVLDEKIKAAAIEYEKDEHGEYRLDEEGNRIPVSRGGMGMSDEFGNMVEFQLYGLTDEQVSKFLHVIETVDKSVDLNSRVYSIVKEEAAAFFAGQKTEQEVAKLIQTKVSLYLGEQG